VYVTGGSYEGQTSPSKPSLYAAEAATGQVSEVGKLSDAAEEAIVDMIVCGNALYSVGVRTQGGNIASTLYAAALTTPATRAALLTTSGVSLENCTPR
jgi:hypothetical protein